MMTDLLDRRFQFWMFRVGHGELLVRSPRDADHGENLDLVFVGVEYVDLPRVLPGIRIDSARPDEIGWLEVRIGRPVDAKKVTVLETEGRRHLVLAAFFKVEENKLDMFEVPFD